MSTGSINERLSSGVVGQKTTLYRDPARVGGHQDDAGRVLDYYQQLVDLAAPRVGVDRLHWLGHFINGDVTFSVDVVDDEHLGGVFSGSEHGPTYLRQALVKLGRRLNYDIPRMDRDLRGLRTGRLVRVLFDVETAGVFWYWIHEREFLLGMTLHGEDVDRADCDMADVAVRILKLLGRASRNYGGFERGLSGRREARRLRSAEDVRLKRSLRAPDDIDELGSRCVAAVDPRDLHYVSLFVDGVWGLSADAFDASPATRNFGGIAAELRRSLYEQVGEQLQYDVAEFDRLLRSVSRHRPGKLTRSVFDVESGALYHHVIDSYRYLVGVTVYQDQVEYAEDRLRVLADQLRASTGGSDQSGVA